MNVAKSVRVALAINNKKRKWLALELGVTEAYVSALCNDKKHVSMTQAAKLADLFDVPFSKFISWGELQ